MLRYVVLLLALLVGACTPIHHFNAPIDHLPDAKQLADTTVALVEEDGAKQRSYCSGVWVSPTEILTADHCVKDFALGDAVAFSVKSDEVDLDHAFVRSALLASTDAPHDLALLSTHEKVEHPIAHVAFAVAQGEFVQTMGQSLGLWWTYSNGTVSAIRHWSKPHDRFDDAPVADASDMLWVQTTTPVSGGNSGGGLFDEYGDLVGLCHGSFSRGQNMNLFVHRDHIAAFLRAQKVTP